MEPASIIYLTSKLLTFKFKQIIWQSHSISFKLVTKFLERGGGREEREREHRERENEEVKANAAHPGTIPGP